MDLRRRSHTYRRVDARVVQLAAVSPSRQDAFRAPQLGERLARNARKHGFESLSSISALFAWAFNAAATGLPGSDLAALAARKPTTVTILGWIGADSLSTLQSFVQALADREVHQRYKVRRPQTRRIEEILGNDFHGRPRACFILAAVIDSVFGTLADDLSAITVPDLDKAAPIPPSFLNYIPNPPPPLGQMTSFAICQRWMKSFRLVASVQRVDGFGTFPVPKQAKLPATTRQRLLGALESDKLVVGVAPWRLHAPSDLNVRRDGGRFAIVGNQRVVAPDLLERVVRAARKAQAHVLMFPEVALSPSELSHLQALLKSSSARYPVLVVAGRTHVQAPASGSFTNEAMVYTSEGDEIFRHEKLEPFTLSGELEDILPRQSQTYNYLDTPIGRLVINICRDVRSDVPMILNRALGATILLVPAYSKRLDFAMEEAHVLGARQGTITVAVNPLQDPNCGLPERDKLRDAAAAYIPALLPLGADDKRPPSSMAISQPEVRDDGKEVALVLFTFDRAPSTGAALHYEVVRELP